MLGLIEVQQQLGTATELQVEQQRTPVATFDAGVPVPQQQADLALHRLAVLTGRAPEGFRLAARDLRGPARPVVLPDRPGALRV